MWEEASVYGLKEMHIKYSIALGLKISWIDAKKKITLYHLIGSEKHLH